VISKKICVAVTLVILLTVVIVFLAPSLDLEPSALRAWRAAAMVFLAIVIAVQFLAYTFANCLLEFCKLRANNCPYAISPAEFSLLDLYCTRLC
jgi:hypothetical protein